VALPLGPAMGCLTGAGVMDYGGANLPHGGAPRHKVGSGRSCARVLDAPLRALFSACTQAMSQ